jgi:ATP-dependent DNA helicase RecG
MASPFQAALDAVLRPLEFAARDGFAHLERVQDLERSVARAAARARALAIPADAREALRQVEEAFPGPLEAAERRRRVERALGRLRPLAEPGFAERALARPATALPGVGPRRGEVLARRGLATVGGLLFHLPVRWDDRRSLVRVGELQVGRRATFVARVLACDFATRRGRGGRLGRTFEALVGDDTGSLQLKWFHGGEAISRVVRKGARLLVTGEVRRYRFAREILHPEIEPLGEEGDEGGEAQRAAGERSPSGLERLVPDYATPEGLHPRALRTIVRQAVEHFADLVPGYLPPAVARERGLPEPAEALRLLHTPGTDADVEALREGTHPARARLVLEELYLLEVGLALRRAARAREPGIAIAGEGSRVRAALRRLPFRLTHAQERAWREIREDLARPHPMQRLLEGDVGSGKTVVAFLAAVAVAESGHQTALMAPTELLAEQHARTLQRLVDQTGPAAGVRLRLLTSSLARAEAEAARRELGSGEVDLAVGTHALIQEGVAFRSLGLVVVDEQHRFGVRQRAALAAKGEGPRAPHTLVMTATPIPRTLALTVWGDLDLSVIDELPGGRQPVRTLLVRPGEGRRVMQLLRETVARGEQAYVVYPLVEETEGSDLRAASESAERIRAALPGRAVDLVHGRLEAAERARAMARFEAGETAVLVATTVIEVGVDVPRATLMIVEHAERFGLAQLHQLRGRVGRSERQGTCVLVARGVSDESEARLAALLETTDGFAIAEADLRIRGPGEFLGTRQHGRLLDLRLADLVRDARLVSAAREAALATLRRDPGLRAAPELARAVQARWGERLALVDVG